MKIYEVNIIDTDSQQIYRANGTITETDYRKALNFIAENGNVKLYKGFATQTDCYNWISSELPKRRYATGNEVAIFQQYFNNENEDKIVAIDELKSL